MYIRISRVGQVELDQNWTPDFCWQVVQVQLDWADGQFHSLRDVTFSGAPRYSTLAPCCHHACGFE